MIVDEVFHSTPADIMKHQSKLVFARLLIFQCAIISLALQQTQAQAPAKLPTSYWPEDVDFDSSIPTPNEFFGFEVGQHHLTHAQVVRYMERLAETSDRVTIKQTGRTHGGRPLLLLTITSAKNRDRLDEIQKQHYDLSQPAFADEVDVSDLPAVINMGYGVHGDESSATNCTPLVVHYLAAAKGDEIDAILSNCVILLDPSLNPDGFNRFANWANMFRGKTLNPDPRHAEHNQNWPPGRVNYYWFDLNRDWLPLEHPESRTRMTWYHSWKPNVVLDFHEMGTNSTYFFQPGVPERKNPYTPMRNLELTGKFASYHAKALDDRGSLYFTMERFDDFYMGKGSTYPDLHGAIGILFEQASSRGHVQENGNGMLRFHDTIGNQFTTSLSSLRATSDMRIELNEYKRDFYKESVKQSKTSEFKTYIFSSPNNRSRLESFADVLRQHDIQCYWPAEDVQIGENTLPRHTSLVVPTEQSEFRFIKSLLMKQKRFEENVFYDVSAWTLPLAYNLEQFETRIAMDLTGMQLAEVGKRVSVEFTPTDNAVGYLFDWSDDDSPWLVNQLLQNEIKVKVATKTFSIQPSEKNSLSKTSFGKGTILVPLAIQKEKLDSIMKILAQGADRGIEVTSSFTGLTPGGIDFGSGSFANIPQPKIAMPVAGGVSAYGAGEIWHLMDTRIELPITMLKMPRFQNGVDLDDYSALVFPAGNYSSLSEEAWEGIRDWVRAGGTVISVGGSSATIAKKIGDPSINKTDSPKETKESEDSPVQLAFDSASKRRALELISGAIFNTKVDLTHPLFYGFANDQLPVFRNHTTFLPISDNPYCNPAIYDSENPHLAGYCSDENLEKVRDSAAVVVQPMGRGRIILIADNPNFRAFWHGTSRMFLNSIFFGHLTNP